MARVKKESAGEKARQSILKRSAPSGMKVPGKIDFSQEDTLQWLPDDLSVGWLDLSNCKSLPAFPKGLNARRITLQGRWDPSRLLAGLKCFQLDLTGSLIQRLPDDLQVEHRLDLTGCTSLRELPRGLNVGSLVLRDCTSLESLPEDLDCYFLDISGCTSLAGWPSRARVQVGRLAARGCLQLRSLPSWLKSIAQLDLRDCRGISTVPDDLKVSSWIDLAGTGIQSLPASFNGVQIRWRGVAVDARIAFFPELITTDEILAEVNAEKRRVLLERMGYETFLTRAKAEVLHEDRDPGGPRRLLRVPLANDEPLVCVSVLCPSTGRQYVIRVPPTVTTCHEAAAWVAGFDHPDDYNPISET